jgi:hypothetical protein
VKIALKSTSNSGVMPVARMTLTVLAFSPNIRAAKDTAVAPIPALRLATLFTSSA